MVPPSAYCAEVFFNKLLGVPLAGKLQIHPPVFEHLQMLDLLTGGELHQIGLRIPIANQIGKAQRK